MQSINFLFTNYLLSDLVSNDNANKYFHKDTVTQSLNSMWSKMHLKYSKEKSEDLIVSLETLDKEKSLVIIKFPEPKITPESLYAAFILGNNEKKGILFTFDMSPGFDFEKATLKTEQHYTLFKWINGKRNLIHNSNNTDINTFIKIIKENF